jgi:hypothetical protein
MRYMPGDDPVGFALAASLDFLERRRRERLREELEEQQWPSTLYEDVLDADTVKERAVWTPNPIINIGGMV